MTRTARPLEPLAGVTKHGTTRGYDKGCGCLDCRRANRERKNRALDKQAAAKKESSPPPASPTHELGKFRRNVQAFIDNLAVEGEEAVMIGDLMLFNAELLDNIAATGERWHLAGSTQKTLLDLKSQLRRLKDGGEAGGKPAPTGDPKDELAGLLSGLTRQG
jgi:hypothetical protein